MIVRLAGRVALGLAMIAAAASAQSVRVGAARVDMTPGAADLPYAPSDTPSLNLQAGERPFVGVHDPLYARALVADDGGHRIALIALDVTAVPEATSMAASVAKVIRSRPSDVMLAATHTHSVPLFSYAGTAPSPRERHEIARVRDAAVAAARAALAAAAPASASFGRGEAWVNVNNGEQAGSRSGADPHGPSDKTLTVIRFTSADGHPIATVLNYASHAEVMFRSVSRDGGYEISGDVPGAVSRLLEGAPGGSPVVLYTAGAEADQLTLFKARTSAGRLPASDVGAGGWALVDAQARRIADAALLVEEGMSVPAPLVAISATDGSTVCRGQRLTVDPVTRAATVMPAADVAIPLAILKFDDILIGGVGGDVATEIGERFKRDAPTRKAVMVTMAGRSVGYIFADASYVHPGHGLTKSPLAPGCAEQAIVQGLIRLAH